MKFGWCIDGNHSKCRHAFYSDYTNSVHECTCDLPECVKAVAEAKAKVVIPEPKARVAKPKRSRRTALVEDDGALLTRTKTKSRTKSAATAAAQKALEEIESDERIAADIKEALK